MNEEITSVKDYLIFTLESIKTINGSTFPVYQQGTLPIDKEYPQSFFTFWNNNSADTAHYDNKPIAYVWNFDVNFYSVEPDLVNEIMWTTVFALRSAGFIVSGTGYDVASDEITHTGRGVNALYVEQDFLNSHVPPKPLPPFPPDVEPTDDDNQE